VSNNPRAPSQRKQDSREVAGTWAHRTCEATGIIDRPKIGFYRFRRQLGVLGVLPSTTSLIYTSN